MNESTQAETEQNSEHTPGPWRQLEADGTQIRDSDYRFVADASSGIKPRRAEDEANARLIAAAPDLLAACQRALNALSDDDHRIAWSLIEQLKAAIAKATASNKEANTHAVESLSAAIRRALGTVPFDIEIVQTRENWATVTAGGLSYEFKRVEGKWAPYGAPSVK